MWQDYAFAIGGAFFAVCLIPTLTSPEARVPRRTSIPTAAFLGVFVAAHASLGFYWAASMETISALSWAAVAVWKAPS